MEYLPLPETLSIGMRLACDKYEQPEIIEVVGTAGEQYFFRIENGHFFFTSINRQTLVDYDYKLIGGKIS